MNKKLLIALGALTAIVIAATGGMAARAADPGIVQINADVLHASGFGHFDGDVRHLPQGNKVPRDEDAQPNGKAPDDALHGQVVSDAVVQTGAATTSAPTSGASFVGLDHTNWGAGWPPDPNADVGPNHIVETVNTSVGIFSKAGVQLAAFTFDQLWSQAHSGTPCDTSNQGDPVALYDPIGDRFIVSDFAWTNFASGPFYQCFAVSKTGDPVNGGWWFYAYQVESGSSLPDYPKLGIWPDGIYMSANVFASSGSGSFQNVQVWAFNREQMEAGNSSPQAVTAPVSRTSGGVTVFSMLPSNARTVTGLPSSGTPNYFASIYGSYAIRVWKFHVDWTNTANSTFSGPTDVGVSTFNVGPSTVPEQDGNALDTLSYRLMMQNQYTNIAGRESLWLTHTVGSGGISNKAQVRWYELPVTGGTVGPSVRQQSTYAPTSSNRFMPSLAVDKNGDMAIGYSVSDATMYPALRYSGRLAGDALSQLTQGETTLVQGLGFQCCTFSDGSTNTRWGDYSAMTIDPDGCTFWYTGEYYDAHPTTKAEDDWLTRIGSFQLPGCGSSTASAPLVSGFSPTTGSAGTSVSITGSGFTGVTGVTFNSVPAAFSFLSDGQLTATVPANATTGPIAVTTPAGTGTSSSSFTVTVATAGPTISSISPTSGKIGSTVTVTGTHLTGTSSVTFGGGVSTTPTSVTDTQVAVTVPVGARNGPLTVTTPNGSATSSQSFRVSKR